jgi:hypothetical protein
MPISDWHVGQAVVVSSRHVNEGSPKFTNTTITKIARKYISVANSQERFDHHWDVPRSDRYDELYTPLGYQEMLYTQDVLRAFDSVKRGTRWPIELMLVLGDYMGLSRPKHLRDDIDPELLQAIKETNL